LIEGIYRLLLSDEHLPVNIGSNTETSIIDFAKIINRLTNNPSGITFLPEKRLGDDPQRRRPDLTRARSLLGWETKVSIETGLMQTINYFRKKTGLT